MAARIVFGKASYEFDEEIDMQIQVDEPMQGSITFSVPDLTLPTGAVLPAEGTIAVTGRFGTPAADGYTVVRDGADPSRFLATRT